ncbi:MAG: DUF6646 family protein [Flavobacteriales bacterium AspAUS03]
MFYLCILHLFLTWNLNAQAFQGRSDKKLQAGFTSYGYGIGLRGTFDYGLVSWVSIGGGIELYFQDKNPFYLFTRANGHLGKILNLSKRFDIYPGISIGAVGSDKLGIGAHLGVRYFFTPSLGTYIELGSRWSIGMSINI